MGAYESILLTVITAATPLLLAAIGELVVERSGVLNLGVEGMMIVGAVMGFAGAQATGSPYVGALCALLAGMGMALLFGFLNLKRPTVFFQGRALYFRREDRPGEHFPFCENDRPFHDVF